MTDHFADRLLAACKAKGAAVCIGLDPVWERLPSAVTEAHGDPVAAIEAFCASVLQVVAEQVPCVKVQIACFERYGASGVAAYERVVAAAKALGLIVIGDVKRGDIGTSAAHYAAGHLAGAAAADALTVSAYLGADSLEPFIKLAAAQGKGLFALVRTSNPGGDAIQGLPLADGRSVGQAVADMIAEVGSQQATYVGQSGYSLLGAVVGATKPQDAALLRKRMPKQIFLMPGFGAQGGQVQDVAPCFDAAGRGAIITASRSVIYAFGADAGTDWTRAVAAAATDLKQRIAAIAG